MRTISLELLRHGPPHNQLLSPLTPYLALCENHAPVTLHLPFEHHQFLHRLSALTYEVDSPSQRQFQLRDTGLVLGELLGRIPGLAAELNRNCIEQGTGVMHLRLVLSASELALLPYELALSGNGFPGDGQVLALQNQVPLCVTREVRRVHEPGLRWGDDDVRVLFAAASPAGLPAVPLESHLLALRRAVSPWVGIFRSGDDAQRREQVGRRLKVLARATLRDIEQECAEGEYTHVHILAHGLLQRGASQPAFGLALHDPADPEGPPDVVSGERLASALRPMKQPPRNAVNRPHVVTLASCNAAQVSSVIGGGASIAHALHEAGVPLVVAGQFPLSFAGSLLLVKVMYEGLLWGVDPRELLTDLRRRLHSMATGNHDWASIVAYAALPEDFDEQVARQRVDAAKRAIDNAMDFADSVTGRLRGTVTDTAGRMRGKRTPTAAEAEAAGDGTHYEMLRRAHRKIDVPRERMHRLLTAATDVDRGHYITGLLASAAKRLAEVKFWSSRKPQLGPSERESFVNESRAAVVEARSRYWQCFRMKPGQAWASVQYITLTLLLRGWSAPQTDLEGEGEPPQELLRDLWSVARTLSLQDLDSTEKRSSWALGNLIELALLELLMSPSAGAGARKESTIRRDAREQVQRLLNSPQTDPFQIYSTQRQLRRYTAWFREQNPGFGAAAQLAEVLLEAMRDDPTSLAPPTR